MSSSITHTGVGQVSNTNGLGYAFSFATLNREDIQVEIIDPSNNRTTKTVTTHYTIENYLEAGSSNSHIKFVSETARGFQNSQNDASSYKVRIKRQTPAVPKVNFIAGSSITASDLNIQSQQAYNLSEENRDSITSLAAGDATGAIQISGSNIANNSITTDKILDLEVKTGDIDNLAVTTAKIADTAVTDAKLSTISGTKISPDFGSQNIVTTGTLMTGDMTITDASPRLRFTETNADPDYKLIASSGNFIIYDETNTADRLVVNSDGHVDVLGNLDVGAGVDITGNLTISSGDIDTNGNDIFIDNGTIISADTDGAFSNRSGSNIDHIWHNDTNSDSNTGWNFISDGTYKQTGNAKVNAGSIRCYSQDAMMLSNPTDRTINDSDMDDPIHFETVDLKKGGINDSHDGSSNNPSRITVSQDGIYLITCCLSGPVTTHSHGDGIAICLRKNGSIFPRESAFGVESFGSEDQMEWSFTFAITEQLSDNDYLDVVFRNVDVTVQATLNKGYLCVTRLH